MSGTLFINDKATWMPTGWVYDGVLQSISDELEMKDHLTLASTLSDAKIDKNQYGDLQPLDKQQFQMILNAAYEAYEKRILKGPSDFYDPSGYFHYMFAFSELKALLYTDPRRYHHELTGGRLIINDNALLEIPSPFFDMILEIYAAYIRLEKKEISMELIIARAVENVASYDMGILSREQFRYLLEPNELIHTYYSDGKGRMSVAPEFFPQLAPYVQQLYTLVKNDVRAGAGS